jgi:hypothetical protein
MFINLVLITSIGEQITVAITPEMLPWAPLHKEEIPSLLTILNPPSKTFL